jgi:biopolymer transport protein ExbB
MPQTPLTRATDLQDQLLNIFLYLGSTWILYLLMTLSILSFAITLERLVHFWLRRGDLAEMTEAVNHALVRGDVDRARSALQGRSSHAAHVALVGLQALDRGAAATEEVMAGAAVVVRLQMERGVAFLGTLGNNAPFIGLFGTVLGIIRAFHDLSTNTSSGSQAVMAGIAEALVTTAVGLLVALPAVAIFNLLQRRIRVQLAGVDVMGHVLLAYAKSRAEKAL